MVGVDKFAFVYIGVQTLKFKQIITLFCKSSVLSALQHTGSAFIHLSIIAQGNPNAPYKPSVIGWGLQKVTKQWEKLNILYQI